MYRTAEIHFIDPVVSQIDTVVSKRTHAAAVRSPLTDAGMAQYAGILAAGPSGATGILVENYVRVVWTETTPPGTYLIVANDRGAQKVVGQFEIPPGGYKGRIFVSVN